MATTISARGQIVIPVKSSRGMLKGTGVTTTALLKVRKEEKKMEDKR